MRISKVKVSKITGKKEKNDYFTFCAYFTITFTFDAHAQVVTNLKLDSLYIYGHCRGGDPVTAINLQIHTLFIVDFIILQYKYNK